LENPPRGYKPDPASARRLEDIVARLAAKGERAKQLSVTVEGVFYSGGPKPDPSRPPRHPWYPGHIVIQAYRDVKAL
jgi:hypothetical protein